MRLYHAALAIGCSAAWACASRPTPPAGYAEPDARAFIVQHRPELEREINVGSGRNLYQLAIIADCEEVSALGRELHKQRDQIFSSTRLDDAVVADRIVEFMKARPEFRCLDLDLSRGRVFAAGRRRVIGVPEPGTPRMR